MKAMVLAAGLGTRLRPLTNDRPKALVEIGGRTLLEITLTRLRSFGVSGVIINLHHFADMVADYLAAHDHFGMRIELSREDDLLLDTGGGLKKAAHFFLDGDDEPFILHNVDVLSTIDLHEMMQAHHASNALATLAVHRRESSRYLLFDKDLHLCGRIAGSGREQEIVRVPNSSRNDGAPCRLDHLESLAFSGIHVISPRLLELLTDDGVFSIIPAYLKMAEHGEHILGFRADRYYWRDLGTLASLEQAEKDVLGKVLN